MIRARRAWFWIAAAVLVFAVPWPVVVAPEWQIRVLDAKGNPKPGVRVREVSRHFALESVDVMVDGETAADGTVVFPGRRVWGGGLRLAVGYARAFLRSGLDASYGVSVFALVVGPDAAVKELTPDVARDRPTDITLP